MLEKVSNLKKIINVFCMLSTDYCFPNFRGIKMLINLRMFLYVNEHFSVHFFWSLKKIRVEVDELKPALPPNKQFLLPLSVANLLTTFILLFLCYFMLD